MHFTRHTFKSNFFYRNKNQNTKYPYDSVSKFIVCYGIIFALVLFWILFSLSEVFLSFFVCIFLMAFSRNCVQTTWNVLGINIFKFLDGTKVLFIWQNVTYVNYRNENLLSTFKIISLFVFFFFTTICIHSFCFTK